MTQAMRFDIRSRGTVALLILLILMPSLTTTLALVMWAWLEPGRTLVDLWQTWALHIHPGLVAVACGLAAVFLGLARDPVRTPDRPPGVPTVRPFFVLMARYRLLAALVLGAWLAIPVPLLSQQFLAVPAPPQWKHRAVETGLLGTLFILAFFLSGRWLRPWRAHRLLKAGTTWLVFLLLLVLWRRLTLDGMQMPSFWHPWTRGLRDFAVLYTVLVLGIYRRSAAARIPATRALLVGGLQGSLLAMAVFGLGWGALQIRSRPDRCLDDRACSLHLLPITRAGQTQQVWVVSGTFGELAYRPTADPPLRFERLRRLHLVTAAAATPNRTRFWVLERRYRSVGLFGYQVQYGLALWDPASQQRRPLPLGPFRDPTSLRLGWSPDGDRLAVAVNHPGGAAHLHVFDDHARERMRMDLRWPVLDLAWADRQHLVLGIQERTRPSRAVLLAQTLGPEPRAELFHLPEAGRIVRMVRPSQGLPYIEYRLTGTGSMPLRIFRLVRAAGGRWRIRASAPIPHGQVLAYPGTFLLVFRPGAASLSRLVLYDGNRLQPRIRYILPRYRRFRFLGVSPGGRRVAFQVGERPDPGEGDLLVLRLSATEPGLWVDARLRLSFQTAAFLTDQRLLVWTGRRLLLVDLSRKPGRAGNR